MNNTIKSQIAKIRELIDSTQDIGIIIGEKQDIDSVGAALGLYLILNGFGKNVQVVSKKDPTVEVSNLFAVNKISKSFAGNTKVLTISVPYREGEIEKVSYNIEGDRLNVNLFAEEAGINFDEDSVQYIRKGANPSLIVTIGISSDAELASYVDPASVKTIHIDRNPLNPLMGDVVLIDPSLSSISEIVAEMIRELSLGYDVDAFQNLMDGISYATQNFTSTSTSAFAFEAAGFLLQNGAKRKENIVRTPFTQTHDRQVRQNDRDRNFPSADQFLRSGGAQMSQPPRPQRNPTPQPVISNQRPRNPQQNPQVQNRPFNPASTPPPTSTNIPQHGPKEVSGMDISDEAISSPFTEGGMPEDIPDDWFLPKVFKGSKKRN